MTDRRSGHGGAGPGDPQRSAHIRRLVGDAKGKGASGRNCEAESTDAPVRGGLLCSRDEAG
jgi:hypothetical protein